MNKMMFVALLILSLQCSPSLGVPQALVGEAVMTNSSGARLARAATTQNVTDATTQQQQVVNRTHHSNETTVYPTQPRVQVPSRGVPVDFSICPNSCNGRGLDCIPSVAGKADCLCRGGFVGESCERWVGCADANSCSGHGKCQCGLTECFCQCKPGWMGNDCNTPVGSQCPNHCSGRGSCKIPNFECECEVGFTGPDCSRAVVPSPCENACSGQGSCNAESKVCACSPGFAGTDCSTTSDDCGGCRHGKCHQGRCLCQPGFTGLHCEDYSKEFDLCAANGFCSGFGVCLNNGSCTCQDGFTGDACDTIAATLPTRGCINHCSGHGRCDSLLSECVCDVGYGGPACAESLCPTSNGDVCSGRGVCVQDADDLKCQCDPCFDGPDCSDNALEQCPDICNEHGVCVCTKNTNGTIVGQCECEAGWEGQGCQTQTTTNNENDECCPDECSGNGQCNNCTCSCFEGWSGDDCATPQGSSVVVGDVVEEQEDDEDVAQVVSLLLQTEEGKKFANKDLSVGTMSMAALWE